MRWAKFSARNAARRINKPPTARTITVNLASLKAPASAKWFDPTNGAYTSIAGAPFANTGTRQFTPPGNNHEGDSDWVLLLDASGSTP